jgi:iron-sulfur cluster insertion protein
MITLTDSAINKVKEILSEEPTGMKLRTFVEGGGCSGFQYGFTLDNTIAEDDFELPFDGITVIVDSMSAQYLQGAEIDYLENSMGASFSIKNPQATTTCGCGSSFSV